MAKYILEQIKVEGALTELLSKSNGENVAVTYNGAETTLTAALASIYTSLTDLPTGDGVDAKISAAIDELIGGAPAAYDTLKEIADYIAAHKEVSDALSAAIGNKVDKVAGKGLSTEDFTAALKTKLEGIEAGANKYTHPAHTAKASGLYKVTVDAQGHVSAATAVVKSDITALGIPGQDTTYTPATTAKDGLMGKADKARLDALRGVRYGATAPADMQDGEMFVRVAQ